jgi:predicted ATP-grasp superfamily ATP-dependent carboligase
LGGTTTATGFEEIVSQLLAIVGASVRAAAASAVRAGFQVAAADLFADADLRRIAAATRIDNYTRGFRDWLANLAPRPNAWMFTGALENRPDLVDTLSDIAPLWGNRGAVLQAVRSPWRLADVLDAAGLKFPEIRQSPGGLPTNGSWLIKTCRGASGTGVSAFTGDESPVDGAIYERRVPGTPCSAVFAASHLGALLLGTVRQLVAEAWLGARDFQYCGAIGPLSLPVAVSAEIVAIGRALAQAFELRGLFGVDLVIDGDKVWVIEVNPRYTASIEVLERASGIQAIKLHAATCSERPPIAVQFPANVSVHGKAILFAKQNVLISTAISERLNRESAAATPPSVADIPAAEPIARGRPIVTIFAESTSAERTLQILQNRVVRIEQTLYS